MTVFHRALCCGGAHGHFLGNEFVGLRRLHGGAPALLACGGELGAILATVPFIGIDGVGALGAAGTIRVHLAETIGWRRAKVSDPAPSLNAPVLCRERFVLYFLRIRILATCSGLTKL